MEAVSFNITIRPNRLHACWSMLHDAAFWFHLIVLCAAVGTYGFFAQGQLSAKEKPVFLLWLAALVTAAVLLPFVLWIRKERAAYGLPMVVRYTFAEAGLWMHTPGAGRFVPWTQVIKVAENEKYIVLHLDAEQEVMTFEKSHVSADELKAVKDFLSHSKVEAAELRT